MQELSVQLDGLRRENAHLRVELDNWYHRAGQAERIAAQQYHHQHAQHAQQQQHEQQQQQQQEHVQQQQQQEEEVEVKDAHLMAAELLVEAAAAEKDKRARSDSITTGAELLGGFKKQRVESPQLSITTGAEGGREGGQGVMGGQEVVVEEEGGKGVGREGGKKEVHTGVFGEGYETPRNTIKGNAIAL